MRTLSVLLALLLTACAGGSASRQGEGRSALAVVEAYVAAFNRHDAAAASALLAPDLQWLAIAGDRIELEASGREAMRQSLQSYFQATPDVRSEVQSLARGQQRVAVYECVAWREGSARQQRCAHGLYQVQGGLIQRAWFWPAEGAP